MDKKAILPINETDTILFFVVIVLPILMLVFGFSTSIAGTIQDHGKGTIPQLEYKAYESALLRNCFVEEKNSRDYNMKLDEDKISEESLRDCLPLTSRYEGGIFIDLSVEELGIDRRMETENVHLKTSANSYKTTYPVTVDGYNGLMELTYLY